MADISRHTKSGKLSDDELTLVKELVHESLDKAATSMAQMLRIRIKPELLDFGNGFAGALTDFDQLGRFKVHVVKVKFKGEINGAFYFLINDHEVDLINRVCLPTQFISGKRIENKMMKHGFMMEIENLIAALSLKEISEFLGVQLMGGVPDMQVLKGSEVNDYLYQENIGYNTAFFVQSVLASRAVEIAPYFIWMLDQEFIDKLRLNIVT
jgi:chemotaxis protein CheY-P-specific phosphatase CheC